MAEPTLKQGSTGPAVKDLQLALQELGHSPGKIDGVFGGTTEKAVEAFQATLAGATVDGVVGPFTWRSINFADTSEPVLKNGSTGLPVRRLQDAISSAGFDTGGVDGRFGPSTEAAVKKLQKAEGLAVDGIVGPATWAIIDAFDV
ncbi:MAG: peptidoglycan-binding domain-containing protein [Solirubrobacteraceae bacterium]